MSAHQTGLLTDAQYTQATAMLLKLKGILQRRVRGSPPNPFIVNCLSYAKLRTLTPKQFEAIAEWYKKECGKSATLLPPSNT